LRVDDAEIVGVIAPIGPKRARRRQLMDALAVPRRNRRLRPVFAATAAALSAMAALSIAPTGASADKVRGVEVFTDIPYTVAEPAGTLGNLLDLYIPQMPGRKELPLVIWTSGSAWFSDNGKAGAESIAAEFNPRGYAVAGVSVRSSFQVKFPGQLYDIRAAIRWLRSNGGDYSIDPDRIAIMGNSSGGWVSAIAATTSDILQLEGEPDVGGVSSAVQAAVPFFPPTEFLRMNEQFSVIDHDSPFSPESLLVGCAIQTCPEATQAANPISYVNGLEPRIHVFHGTADPLVPPNQSMLLYEALKSARSEVSYTLVEGAGHSVEDIIGADVFTVSSVNAGGRERVGQKPAPTWSAVEHFIHVSLSRAR
jgi:acetyl esterase/lipase